MDDHPPSLEDLVLRFGEGIVEVAQIVALEVLRVRETF